MSKKLIETFQQLDKTGIIKYLQNENMVETILDLDKTDLDSIINEIVNKLSVGQKELDICIETSIDCKILNELRHLELSFIFNKINKSISDKALNEKVEEGTWYRVWQEDIATKEELEELKLLPTIEEQKRYVQEKINENRTKYLGLPKIFLNEKEQKQRNKETNGKIKNNGQQLTFNKATGGEPDVIMYNPNTYKLSFGMANKFVDNKMEGTQDTRHLGLLVQTRRTLKEKDLDITNFSNVFNDVSKKHGGKNNETTLWENIVDNTPKEELTKELNELYSISFYQHYNTSTKNEDKFLNIENEKTKIQGYLNSFMFLAQNTYNELGKYSITEYTEVNTYSPTNKSNLGINNTLKELKNFVKRIDINGFEELIGELELSEDIELKERSDYSMEVLSHFVPTIIEKYNEIKKEKHIGKDFPTLREEIDKKLQEILKNDTNLELIEMIEEGFGISLEEEIEILSTVSARELGSIEYSKSNQKRKKINNSLSNNLETALKIGFSRNKEYREGLFGLLVDFVLKYNSKLLEKDLEKYFNNSKNENEEGFFNKYLMVNQTFSWISNKINRYNSHQKSFIIENKDKELENKDKELIISKIQSSMEKNTVEEDLDFEEYTIEEFNKYRIYAEENIFMELLKRNKKKELFLKLKEIKTKNQKISPYIVEYYLENNVENKENIISQIKLLKNKYNMKDFPIEMEEELEKQIQEILNKDNIDISKEETKELSREITKTIINMYK